MKFVILEPGSVTVDPTMFSRQSSMASDRTRMGVILVLWPALTRVTKDSSTGLVVLKVRRSLVGNFGAS